MYKDKNKDKKYQYRIYLHYIKLTHQMSFRNINLIVISPVCFWKRKYVERNILVRQIAHTLIISY